MFVLTKNVSRLSRDIVVALGAIQQLTSSGVKIHFEAEGIDSDNPDLQVHLSAYFACAEMENTSRDGHSILSIINQLHQRGIESPSGKDTWNTHYIEKMLCNVKYTGDVIVNMEQDQYLYSNHHPAIISRAALTS